MASISTSISTILDTLTPRLSSSGCAYFWSINKKRKTQIANTVIQTTFACKFFLDYSESPEPSALEMGTLAAII
jgi:hypothetical protein